MKLKYREPARIPKLLLENFPEQPPSEEQASPSQPPGSSPWPAFILLAGNSLDRGIRELNSPLSE